VDFSGSQSGGFNSKNFTPFDFWSRVLKNNQALTMLEAFNPISWFCILHLYGLEGPVDCIRSQ
jgi:hypothetical protein